VPEEIGNLQSTMLLAILTLLVENAFEAQPTTSVILSARMINNKLSIFVKDSSGGIPDSEKEFLFEPSKSRKKRGTGLGLAISKQLALSIDAELRLADSDAVGSTFSISLALSTS
jgi:signal transduction histidine kinase